MLLSKERELIVSYGIKLIESGLVKGTGGNLSIFNRDKNIVAISPSGKDYYSIKPEDVVLIDLSGKVIQGKNKPSSEYLMHTTLYKRRKDISAIVHTHSINATTLSCMRKDLPILYYLQVIAGKSPIKCAEYALTGTMELAEAACRAMGTQNAALLANHGVITGSLTLELAYYIAEQIEFASAIYLKAGASEDRIIPLKSDEISEMSKVFSRVYGTAKAES